MTEGKTISIAPPPCNEQIPLQQTAMQNTSTVQQPQTVIVVQTAVTAPVQENVVDSDYKILFRQKLMDPKKSCCCGCECCCSLWIGAHAWLIIFAILSILSILYYIWMINEFCNVTEYFCSSGFITFLWAFISWEIIGLIGIIYCFYGLYTCTPIAFIIYVGILSIDCGLIAFIMIFSAEWILIIDLLLLCWAAWVFETIWKVSKHFKSGGVYNAVADNH